MKRLPDASLNPVSLSVCLLMLRIGVAALMLTHGIPKLLKLVTGDLTFGDPIGLGSGVSLALAAFAEVGCSLLLLLGAATRLATIPLMITMIVAIFFAHGNDPFGKKELPLLYLLIYLVLFILGSGKYAIDSLFKK